MDKKTRQQTAASLRATAAKLAPVAKKVKAADEASPLNPKTAIVYFDLHMAEENLEEDQGPNADEDMKERAEAFLALGKGDLTKAALAAEDAAIKEIGAMLKKAGLNARLNNEGHSDNDLVMKFGVDSLDDVKKLVTFIKKNMGGGDDIIYLNAPYTEARGFQLFPDGVNNAKLMMGGSGDSDLEEWLEAQGAAVGGSTKPAAKKAAPAKKPIKASGDEARIAALAEHLGLDAEEAAEITKGHGDHAFERGMNEFLVLTDDEADEAVKERIEQDVWAFNASFIIEHSDLPAEAEEMVKFFQEKKSEGAQDTLVALIKDMDDFVKDAVSADGRGHFLSQYDGEEVKVGKFFLYRTN